MATFRHKKSEHYFNLVYSGGYNEPPEKVTFVASETLPSDLKQMMVNNLTNILKSQDTPDPISPELIEPGCIALRYPNKSKMTQQKIEERFVSALRRAGINPKPDRADSIETPFDGEFESPPDSHSR